MLERSARIDRKTSETAISVCLNLDGRGEARVDTGIAFLDHMLRQLARHGRFDLEVVAQGDLAVDFHHTAEDVAIALGQCFNRALGERRGIVRMAHALVPLDEALAMVAVDLSGRGYPSVRSFVASGHRIGEIDADVLRHFLETLAIEARMNLHVDVMHGRNAHHKAEATFKALARALGEATRIDPGLAGEIPSSKGVIEDAS